MFNLTFLNRILFFFLQKIMLDFVNIEMIYHAKALEMYTECFQNIKSFDIEEDIEVHIFNAWELCMYMIVIVIQRKIFLRIKNTSFIM